MAKSKMIIPPAKLPKKLLQHIHQQYQLQIRPIGMSQDLPSSVCVFFIADVFFYLHVLILPHNKIKMKNISSNFRICYRRQKPKHKREV